jgi:alkyldihydroxyacetonephosphate synthase
LRYSTPGETETTLALAGHERLIATLEQLLAIRGARDEKCMLLVGFSGKDAGVKYARSETLAISRRYEGVHVGRTFGNQWQKGRFRTPYLRNTLWEKGYAVDTLETALPWKGVPKMVDAIEKALTSALADTDERVHVFTHLSHLYPWGSSVYTTYLFRVADDPEATLERWQMLKSKASSVIVEQGGTISHQHGIGTDHKPYLGSEKGSLGMSAIKEVFREYDPDGIMNPGKLV